MFNKDNFYLSTRATFRVCKRPCRKPDYISYTKWGDVSSEYWYTKSGVVRCSNHWSRIYPDNSGCNRIAGCFWVLRGDISHARRDGFICGYANWTDFKYNHKRVGY